jgi:hypothetical protein
VTRGYGATEAGGDSCTATERRGYNTRTAVGARRYSGNGKGARLDTLVELGIQPDNSERIGVDALETAHATPFSFFWPAIKMGWTVGIR